MKRQLRITVMAVLLTVAMTTTAMADQSEDTDVSVDVDDTVALDVKPDQLDYTEVGSGDGASLVPGEQVQESDRGLEHIDIENIGSDRLDRIYATSDVHDEQPFGTTAGAEQPVHNTGNLVLMSTETAQTGDFRNDLQTGLADVQDPVYLNRVEYFEDNPPEYIQTLTTDDTTDVEINVGEGADDTQLSDEVDEVDVGRFRTGEVTYFVTYVETTNEELLFVGNTPETPTQLGTFDFTNENEAEYTVIGLDSDDGAGETSGYSDSFELASFNPDSYDGDEPVLDSNSDVDVTDTSLEDSDVEVRAYNLYADRTQDNELLARVSLNTNFETPNGQSTNIDSTGGQQFILDADGTESEALQPGENFPINFGVQLPNGIDNEQIEPGTVTFNAEAFTTS